MAEFNVALRGNIVPEKVRLSAMAKCYSYILSLDNPREKTEPVAEDLGGDPATGSRNETSAGADGTTSNHPVPQQAVDKTNYRGSP